MTEDNNLETILQLGGEGGSITVLGRKIESGEWVFYREVNELFLYEEGNSTVETNPFSIDATGWTELRELITSYPIAHLVPRKIHSDFGDQIWEVALNSQMKKQQLRRWAKACFPSITDQHFELFYQIYRSNHTVVLTGAGMSTESGVPDFRSKAGWWKSIDPMTVATTDALEYNYELFHEFYSERLKGLEKCVPHDGHTILGRWQEKGLVQHLATQNVDLLHEAGGSNGVPHLHGSILTFRCHSCQKAVTKQQFLDKQRCTSCEGKLRPNVVLFGEQLPEYEWNQVLLQIKKADLVIVIGTSLQVYPVSQLPAMTDGKRVYLNREVNEHKGMFDVTIEGSAREVLMEVEKMVSACHSSKWKKNQFSQSDSSDMENI
ncbi:SIR2 family NAD-dependent protein deacylase [Bacillus sp. FJAT-45037]|uniref:SIR2 family NAD-dependent protein deacylase n=1 Tax=Bacillus sp. FJAT-45037 TaxID=2011007 RepID=UPI002FCDA64D